MLKDMQALMNQTGNVDWEIHFVDSTIVQAHQHTTGAKKYDPETDALGRSVSRQYIAPGVIRPIAHKAVKTKAKFSRWINNSAVFYRLIHIVINNSCNL